MAAIHFNDENWESEVIQSEVPVLVDFAASWCGPCKVLAPTIDKLAQELAGKAKVGKVDIDASPGIATRYGVRSVPTVMVFSGGQRVAQHVGMTTRENLLKLLPQ